MLTPLIIPLVFMLATALDDEDQLPPVVALLIVAVVPLQIADGPDIGDGAAKTVTTVVATHPLPGA